MGLREEKAARTREQIIGTALTLFLYRGYESTTMEEVAERAEVSASTLYRYFPTKDQLVLEPLALSGHLANDLRSRPADEALDLALGSALRAVIVAPRAEADRLRQISAVLESSPALQTRLIENLNHERTLLSRAIADRLGRPAGDPSSEFTARVATTVLELIAERAAELAEDLAGQPDRVVELARVMMDELRLDPPVLPRLGPPEPSAP